MAKFFSNKPFPACSSLFLCIAFAAYSGEAFKLKRKGSQDPKDHSWQALEDTPPPQPASAQCIDHHRHRDAWPDAVLMGYLDGPVQLAAFRSTFPGFVNKSK
jgi:hypothetical protein